MRDETPMVIDCQTCPVRQVRCDDCIVTALGGLPLIRLTDAGLRDRELPLDPAERRALDVMVNAGLVGRAHAATVSARRELWSGVQAVG